MTLKQQLVAWKERGPLRTWRLNEELSLHDCATLLGVGVTQVQLLEAGTVEPTEETIAAIARLMKRRPATLEHEWDRWLEDNPGAPHGRAAS